MRKFLTPKFWSHGTHLGSLGGLEWRNQRFRFANHGFLITLIVVYNAGVVARLVDFAIPSDNWGLLCYQDNFHPKYTYQYKNKIQRQKSYQN